MAKLPTTPRRPAAGSKIRRSQLLCVAVFFLPVTASAPAQERPIVYENATIETVDKQGRMENASLVVHEGKIHAAGKEIKVPADAKVVDARGKTIMPGIVDPFWEVRVASGSSASTPRTIVIGGRTITLPSRGSSSATFTKLADNFYPYDRGFKPLPRSGLTTLNLVSSGYGQSALVRVTTDNPETMLQQPDGILYTDVSNDSTSLGRIRNGLGVFKRQQERGSQRPSGRAGSGDAGRTGPAMGRSRGSSGRGSRSSDATRELWQAIYEGKKPLFVDASNAAAILHLLTLLEDYKKVTVVLRASGADVVRTLPAMKGHSIQLILKPTVDVRPNSRDRINVPKLASQAGIPFAFTQTSQTSALLATQDVPLFPVAYLIKCGLPRQKALEALTLTPATMLGMDKELGTIAPGKTANLLVFDGDPVEPTSRLRQVLIEGRIVHED